jgi:hypothetical protein
MLILSHPRALVATAAALLGAFALAGAGLASSTARATTSTTVSIPATQAFTDTGVALSAGQTVSITVTGRPSWGGGLHAGPKGIAFSQGSCPVAQYTYPTPFTAPGQACYSAIGQLGGTSIVFEVGKTFSMTTPVDGELMLGYNDNFYGDNSGHFEATITVS